MYHCHSHKNIRFSSEISTTELFFRQVFVREIKWSSQKCLILCEHMFYFTYGGGREVVQTLYAMLMCVNHLYYFYRSGFRQLV